MDVESYQLLVLKTKDSLDTRFCRKALIATHFSSVLEECRNCISLSLDLVTKLLEASNTPIDKLCGYIEDAVTLIQMLSDFIKCVIESTAMSCCSMKPFPVTTGNIILTVFMHCKDSEYLYGNNLKSVEVQLKDLFRTCHELQLTYLMTLEKHFMFDLTENEQQDILIEALNINMRIGEIVPALDIKTMAEQWKAYTVLCEKYSNFLQERNIYNKCAHLFATIIMDNIKTALKPEQDNKSVVRSLKVANFTIKILVRVSNVFKHATSNNYDNVVELLQYIYTHNPAHLEQIAGNSEQLTNLFVTNVLSPTDSLCNVLIQDERFLDYIYKIEVKKKEPNPFLGYIILVISLMKAAMHRNEDQVKRKIIDCVFKILPMGHYWFNMKLGFHISDNRSFELYEYLLVHTVAFACTLNSEQYAILERYMYLSVLSTDCYKAIFSSNLWVIAARISNDQLVLETLKYLIISYEKLQKHDPFKNSPQETHLRYTIGNLFQILSDEDKIVMSKQFQPQNTFWSILRVCNLPHELQSNIEADIIDDMKKSIDICFKSAEINQKDVTKLIQILNVAATCSFLEHLEEVERCIVKLWLKVCYKNKYIQLDFVTIETEWFYKYLEALVALTECMSYKFSCSVNLGKIIHIISTILESCNTEMVTLLFNLYCSIVFDQQDDKNQFVAESMFKNTLKRLLQTVEAGMRSFILENLSKYKRYERFLELTSALFCENDFLKNEWTFHCDIEYNPNNIEWTHKLLEVTHNEFIHKCIRTALDSDRCLEATETIKNTQSNFDLGDFLFDDDCEEEPSRKKAKLCLNEVDPLVEALENNVALLCKNKTTFSSDHKRRIDTVINKLRNIIS